MHEVALTLPKNRLILAFPATKKSISIMQGMPFCQELRTVLIVVFLKTSAAVYGPIGYVLYQV